MSIHIGIISTVDGCTWAGSEETWFQVARYAKQNGCKLSILVGSTVAKNKKLKSFNNTESWIRPVPSLGRIARRLANRRCLNRFQSLLYRRPDVLFVSMGGVADAIWMPDLMHSIERTSIPVVLFVQANAEGMIRSEWERRTLRRLYAIPRSVILLSAHNQELLERQMGTRVCQAVRIMNPLRDPVPEQLAWPSTSSCIHFAQVARLELADKQQDHLLKALSTDSWRTRSWSLKFYGSGPDKEHILRLINYYNLSDKVSFGGFISDFREIWKNNHLHILPSRREGMPLALIESMACGRPAVVTRAGGSAELVQHDLSGWICNGMHPEVLEHTLEYAWQKREQWKTMGDAARHRVLSIQEHDWAGTILAILEKAASQKP